MSSLFCNFADCNKKLDCKTAGAKRIWYKGEWLDIILCKEHYDMIENLEARDYTF